MKAVYLQEPGGPEAMVYGDLPDPEVAPGEVMLRVHGSALNRADMGMRSRGRSGQGPRIMGMDVAGEIVSISPDANTTLQVGDRVLLENRVKCHACEYCVDGNDQYCTTQLRIGVDLDGGHAEYITAPAINAYKIPDGMSYAEAAAIPLAGHTAWQCMVVQGQVKPWDDVLIQAAGSGVASMAIQIAKMVGARVITTAGSGWKLEEAKKWGADEVINYRETDNISERVKELTDGKGVDLVFDVVGADVWEQNLLSSEVRRETGDNGRYVGGAGRHQPVHPAGTAPAPDGQRGPHPPQFRRPDEVRQQRGTEGHRGPDLPPDRGA